MLQEAAISLRRNIVCGALALALACGIPLGAQRAKRLVPHQLYLLAGTVNGDYGYPATLYRASDGKLRIVREVLPQTEGLRSVQSWGDIIFLVHSDSDFPFNAPPHAVNIIHTEDPLRVDDLEFSPAGSFPNYYLMVPAEPRPSKIDELLPVTDPQTIETLVAVSDDAIPPAPRVKSNAWNEYAELRIEGNEGGPEAERSYPGLFVRVIGAKIVLALPDHPVVIDTLSPTVIDALPRSDTRDALIVTPGYGFRIIVASRRYLAFAVTWTANELNSGKAGDAQEMFVHDRTRNTWKTIQVEGNMSRCRLFGSWLETIVEMYHADGKPTPGPGKENERGPEAFGAVEDIAGSKGNPGYAPFPDVRDLYASEGNRWLPGVLVLQNLADGRKITIETHQEDSEVLSVRGDAVLYRVNDTIYQAKIVGNKLENSSVLVKDEGVSEIHWVFWSAAK